jgi:hypothetical protein
MAKSRRSSTMSQSLPRRPLKPTLEEASEWLNVVLGAGGELEVLLAMGADICNEPNYITAVVFAQGLIDQTDALLHELKANYHNVSFSPLDELTKPKNRGEGLWHCSPTVARKALERVRAELKQQAKTARPLKLRGRPRDKEAEANQDLYDLYLSEKSDHGPSRREFLKRKGLDPVKGLDRLDSGRRKSNHRKTTAGKNKAAS